jgi:hemin uptake protein HemP
LRPLPGLGPWLLLLAGVGPSAAAAAEDWLVGRWGRDAVPCAEEAYTFADEGTFDRVRDGVRVNGAHVLRRDELVLIFHDGHLYRWRVQERSPDRLRFIDAAGASVELRRCP